MGISASGPTFFAHSGKEGKTPRKELSERRRKAILFLAGDTVFLLHEREKWGRTRSPVGSRGEGPRTAENRRAAGRLTIHNSFT